MDELRLIILRNPLLKREQKVALLDGLENKPPNYCEDLRKTLLGYEDKFFAEIPSDKKDVFAGKLKAFFKVKSKEVLSESSGTQIKSLKTKINGR